MAKSAEVLFLILSFGMLWIPLGQHSFLIEHWMKLGTFMAPFLLFSALAFQRDAAIRRRIDSRTVSLLLLVAYILHQFEEHWVDIYGNTYAFHPYINTMLSDLIGRESGVQPILSDTGVFVINTSLVWLVGALAIWRGPTAVFPTLCMAAIVVVNAISHLVAFGMRGEYNPGLLTGTFVFLPLGVAAYGWAVKSANAGAFRVLFSLLWGVFAHVVMIGGMLMSGWLHALSEEVYFALLAIWSILPVFLFNRISLRATRWQRLKKSLPQCYLLTALSSTR